MNRRTAPPAFNLYQAHRLEAKAVKASERKLYAEHAHMAETYPRNPNDSAEAAAEKAVFRIECDNLNCLHKNHEFAHVALARGIMRNRKHYEKDEVIYQQEALEDATEQGYNISGW